jgi:hypothetical protein
MSERPTCRLAVVPARKGGHVTFALPVRNRAKHVWSFWSNVKTRLKAAHFRCGAHKKAPPPLPPANPAACAPGSPRCDWVASIALLFAERLGQPSQFSRRFVHGYGNGSERPSVSNSGEAGIKDGLSSTTEIDRI